MTDSIIESPRAAEARAERRAAHGANQRPSRRRKAVVAGVVAGAVGVGGSLTGAFLHDQARIEANTIAKRSVSITVDGDVAIALDGLPADVITMNSRARFCEENTGREYELTLAYPREADAAVGKVSVFTPAGAALLGLSANQSIDWATPDGKAIRLKVLEVTWQPEAAGQYDL